MGLLIDGTWHTDWYSTKESDGAFVRPQTAFRRNLAPDSLFKPEANRYHLYVSHACPWAHRTLIARHLKGLEAAISSTSVNAFMGDGGWAFSPEDETLRDVVNGCSHLRDVYCLAQADYTGLVTVPVLWDRQENTIVNNESSEILRILNQQFGDLAHHSKRDLYPEAMRADIDVQNAWVYPMINNGVYRAGFATSQSAYAAAVDEVFTGLERAETILSQQPYLAGSVFTEADLRLWTTLIRFDIVYASHFKCSRKRIIDYPNLWAFTRQIYQMDGVAERTNFDHIAEHYYRSHPMINPTRVVPARPNIDFLAPHDRGPVVFCE